MISERQKAILRCVVEAHLDSGRPVGSKAIAESGAVGWSPSTVRSELAALEDEGLLAHPHTSAGRVPTDAGYRAYVDGLLASPDRLPAPRDGTGRLEARREVDEAIEETLGALTRVTDLMALATAPPLEDAQIHRVEVLLLGPRVVMVVVITSTGEVAKRVFRFDSDVDPGLVEWASSYLQERLRGLDVGARMLAGRLRDPELGETERGFIDEIASAFERAAGESALFVDGTSRLLAGERAREVPRIERLAAALEERAVVLELLRIALDRDSVWVWIGRENPRPELRGVSIVGANYGLGYRNLGTVGVIGPMRMDYPRAIASVRSAAGELSRFFETVYEG